LVVIVPLKTQAVRAYRTNDSQQEKKRLLRIHRRNPFEHARVPAVIFGEQKIGSGPPDLVHYNGKRLEVLRPLLDTPGDFGTLSRAIFVDGSEPDSFRREAEGVGVEGVPGFL
jgi:hypothetical protein